jgi:hypothetical protein
VSEEQLDVVLGVETLRLGKHLLPRLLVPHVLLRERRKFVGRVAIGGDDGNRGVAVEASQLLGCSCGRAAERPPPTMT